MAANRAELRPDPIDLYVGLKLREARKARGCLQDELAKALGLIFQQVQKYEKGSNRISCSMLVKSARNLHVSTNSLLLAEDAEAVLQLTTLHLITAKRGGDELIQAYSRIKPARLRRQLVSLAKALAVGDIADAG